MTHPSPEDLLLWRSGELDAVAASEIPQHLRDCDACRSKVDRADAVLGDLANARTLLRRRSETHRRRRIAAIGTIVTAITVLLAGTLMTLTPSAKAEALLVKAVEQKSRAPRRNRTLRLTRANSTARCASSMSTSAKVPGPTWQPGMFIAPRSSAVAKSRTASLRWTGSSAKS